MSYYFHKKCDFLELKSCDLKNPTNVICRFLEGVKKMCPYLFQFFLETQHNCDCSSHSQDLYKNNKFDLMENMGNLNLNCMASNMVRCL
jgi:hypothetical protein